LLVLVMLVLVLLPTALVLPVRALAVLPLLPQP
jgi:hypothetical protein